MRRTHQSHPLSSTHPSCPPHSIPWDSQIPDGQPLGQTRSLPKHSTSLPSLPAIPEPGQLCSLHLPSLHTTLQDRATLHVSPPAGPWEGLKG